MLRVVSVVVMGPLLGASQNFHVFGSYLTKIYKKRDFYQADILATEEDYDENIYEYTRIFFSSYSRQKKESAFLSYAAPPSATDWHCPGARAMRRNILYRTGVMEQGGRTGRTQNSGLETLLAEKL
ncbi:MAG: hypothetical protein AB7D37_07525 [Desulfovibrio sp.]